MYTAALRGFSFTGSDRAASGMSRNPKVLRVDANRRVSAVEVPTGVVRIDSRNSGGTHTVSNSGGAVTGSGVRVAVLDTGVDGAHAEFGGPPGRVEAGKDCIGETSSTYDGNGHGTHVAGTIAGAQVGVAPGATIVAVKVLDSGGSGSWDSVICGVDYVAHINGETIDKVSGDSEPSNDIDVANMSLGGSSSETATSCSQVSKTTLYTAICKATQKALFAVSAGNDGRNAEGYVPAKYPEVLTVSAFSDLDGARDPGTSECVGMGPWKDCDETFARFSNYGEIVDVMAPGVRIYSSVPGGYDTYSGTSMSAPHVAGVAALVLENDTLTVSQLETRLESTGECPDATWATSTGTCTGSWSGDGDTTAEPMVNAARAVSNTTGGDSGSSTSDTTAPSPSIVQPSDGSIVSGTQTIEISAVDESGGSGVAAVEWRVDSGSWQAASLDGTTWKASWNTASVGDGGHTVSARATDGAGNVSSAVSVGVTVDNSTSTGDITLSATTSKAGPNTKVALSWGGASGSNVDIYRNGALLITTANDGFHEDNLKRLTGNFTYRLCEAASTVCSNDATITAT